MKIGMCDLDFTKKSTVQLPSLEIAKLTSYYRGLDIKNYVVFEENASKYKEYDLFYIAKDQTRRGVQKYQFVDDRITYLGRYFSNEYIPMKREIEECEPDLSIFDAPMRKKIINNETRQINRRLVGDFYPLRLFYDGWTFPYKQKYIEGKNVTIYDYDFTKWDGWKERALDIRQYLKRGMNTNFPVIIRSNEDLHFVIDNDIFHCQEGAKIELDIDELFDNPVKYTEENIEYLRHFGYDTGFIYINKLQGEEDKIDNIARIFDLCMFFVSKKIVIPCRYYNVADEVNLYEKFMKEISYYFNLRIGSSFCERLQYRTQHWTMEISPTYILEEIKERYPVIYEKMNIKKSDVKYSKEWEYGQS